MKLDSKTTLSLHNAITQPDPEPALGWASFHKERSSLLQLVPEASTPVWPMHQLQGPAQILPQTAVLTCKLQELKQSVQQ